MKIEIPLKRKVDNLNRVTIPKIILNELKINSGDELEIYLNVNNEIVLKKIVKDKE
jgi:AbrB family transcriptional regulator (stage V sporulation protein T)